MKISKTNEERGDVGDSETSCSYINDFDIFDDYIFYNILNGMCRVKFGKRIHKKVLLSFNLSETYGSLSVDRKRRLLITANSEGGLVKFRINEEFELEQHCDIIPLYETRNSDNAISTIEVCSKKHIMFVGIGWSKNENQQGTVFMVKNYSEDSFEVEKLVKQKEGVKSIALLKSRETRFIFGGGKFYGEDHEWKLYDFEEKKQVLVSDKHHQRPIRDIVTFIDPKDQEEKIVTCSSDKTVGIWRLSGQLVHFHDFKEMHSALLQVNNGKLIVSSNWGSLFTFDLMTYKTNHVVKKDDRGSTTHVGRCVWIKKTNFFIGTHGDGTIRRYKLEGDVEREFFEEEELDLDEKERIEFISSLETMEKSEINVLNISLMTTKLMLPTFFLFE